MAQPPQTYELTTFSTLVLLCLAAIFMWLFIKALLSCVGWILSLKSSSKKQVSDNIKKEGEMTDTHEEDAHDGDISQEPADLDTKKGK
ncbi:hypothetical protein ACF0H5_013418 [Mactra antiquata]